jgi:Calcium-activated chloride channel
MVLLLYTSLQDYMEMVVQFGYTTMFIAGFPLATFLSFVNKYAPRPLGGLVLGKVWEALRPVGMRARVCVCVWWWR